MLLAFGLTVFLISILLVALLLLESGREKRQAENQFWADLHAQHPGNFDRWDRSTW